MVSPAFPGVFFCFAAMVLLIFVSVSVPVWDKITFLDSEIAGKAIGWGVWGYTGSSKGLGYTIDSSALGLNDSLLNTSVLRNLTYILVLHPIGAGLSFLAFMFGLCGSITYNRVGTILMTLISSVALLVTVVAFAIDMILFTIIRSRIRADATGNTASLGKAIWITLGALAALVLGTCAAGCGSFGRYRHRRPSERRVKAPR
ncbi:pali-domain-containing protein [Clavulina sp. PMI_390]|nr:pali-domain-containing protein [Clavulina sp. PMI_390]